MASEAYTPGPNAVDISPHQDRKVLKEILTPGVGDETPGENNKVYVHYTGTLLDGTKFDSSVDRDTLFEFNLGKGEVIKAWDVGVATMKKGEKCILTCHPDYAYGENGSPPKIPASATLLFEVELFKWDMEDLSEDKDGGILRTVLEKGSGFATPDEGTVVEVHLVGKHEDKVFEDRDVKFEIGVGIEFNVPSGLETALKKFQKGERSKIVLSPKYAFGEKGSTDLNIPPNATVSYEVTLKTFEKEKESWNMSIEQKLEKSEEVKNTGTGYFKDGKFEVAAKYYQKVVKYLEYESEAEGEIKAKRNALLVAGHLNLAACHLKMGGGNTEEVVTNCDKALEIEPKNAKGLFRKGQALLSLQDYEAAKDCFQQVLETDASNKAAQKNIYVCKEHLKKQLEKEKKMYQAIFQKLSLEKDSEGELKTKQENGVAETKEEVPSESVPV